MPSIMQRITPFLWFDTEAEEAAKFYCSLFPNSKILNISHYGKNMPQPEGTVMAVDFELDGQLFTTLNGGPDFKFTEAISFVIRCDSQDEIDRYWNKITANGGAEIQCGWCKDKFGLTWQVVPKVLNELVSSADPAKASRVMQALMKMKKLDIETLKAAYAGHEKAA